MSEKNTTRATFGDALYNRLRFHERSPETEAQREREMKKSEVDTSNVPRSS